MPHGTDESHPIHLPEKPALEGLEDKWTAEWEQKLQAISKGKLVKSKFMSEMI